VIRGVAWLAVTVLSCGCTAGPPNPSLPMSRGEARAALRAMRREPRAISRPVVILGGLHDPGFDGTALAATIRQVSAPDGQAIALTFGKLTTLTFDGCRDYVIGSVERAFGPGTAEETVEVDVVGYSMGGLVARHAARVRPEGGKRLKVGRIFTIATPHRGARLATLPTLDSRAADMRFGSDFLRSLDLAMQHADYELFAYARTNDWIVGVENTAPPGRDPWWVPVAALAPSHLGATVDPRIVADIARRLRGESPFAADPPAPLPGERIRGALVASFPPGVRTEEGESPALLGFEDPQGPAREPRHATNGSPSLHDH
jgi:hypothetical protein